MLHKKKAPPLMYINNKEFTAACTMWKKEVEAYRIKTGDPTATLPVTDYMGESFKKLANKYGMRINFSGYTYIEDMKADAVLCCIKYAHNFKYDFPNPNAFSYFTQYVHNAFLQYLGKEKKFSTFKFQLAKDASPTLAKHDYNDFNMGDDFVGAVPDNDDKSDL